MGRDYFIGWTLAAWRFTFLTALRNSDCGTQSPRRFIARLQQNMDDNAERTRGMVNESVAIQLEFQRAGLHYAVMKGISLSPISVPRPELRHQFDLDYLIAKKSAPEARRILERSGYHLYAISGTTWEFKKNETPNVSIKDLYKDLPYRGVELHLEPETMGEDSRLLRAIHRRLFGVEMPVYSAVDLFLGQAMHAFKDVRSGFSRTAHILEFYRHVLARREDDLFWRELRGQSGKRPRSLPRNWSGDRSGLLDHGRFCTAGADRLDRDIAAFRGAALG